MDAYEYNTQEIERGRLDRTQVAHLIGLGALSVQRANDLVVDGKAGPATQAKIPGAVDLGVATLASASAEDYNSRAIVAGSLSASSQSYLIATGAQAVQTTSGLTVDGKAGPDTRAALDALDPTRQTTPGIDVSHYQGIIDWAAVATKYKFAFIRASEGDSITDSRFAANWAAARAAGVLRGPYHFLEKTPDPVAQARHFAQVVTGAGGLQSGDLPPVLDIEPLRQADPSLSTALTCLTEIERLLCRRPIVYLQWWYYTGVLGSSPALRQYPLWIAGTYSSLPDWTPSFWQFGFDERPPGISAKTDADRFEGTVEQLQALTRA